MTRITGLATGLDVDTIVKQTMQAYQSKIDVQKQKKDILEIKQQLYRDIIKEAQELYNKHFDVLKEGSLIKGSTWQSVQFKSDNSSLTVTGSSSSKVGNYTIESGEIAKAASTIITKDLLEKGLTINGKGFSIDNIDKKSNKEIVDELNKQLANAGFNISVKYTSFTSSSKDGNSEPAFILESKVLGESGSFFVGGEVISTSEVKNGSDATEATIKTSLNVDDLKNNINNNGMISLKIGDDICDINITIDKNGEASEINKNIEETLNKVISGVGYKAKIDELGNISFSTVKTGDDQKEVDIAIKYKNITDTENKGDYISIKNGFIPGKNAQPAELDINEDLSSLDKKIIINGVYIDLSKKGSMDSVEYINDVLKKNNISAKLEKKVNDDKSTSLVLKSTNTGSNAKVQFSILDEKGNKAIEGQNAKIIIKNSQGNYYTYTGDSNTFTVDDVTFNFTGEIPKDGIEVTSGQDSSKIVENIKSYIEDYNSLITKINTLLTEKRASDYQPLTDVQKAEMSDKEIELWEAKVKQGQLRNDSDLRRISSALRQGMTSLVSGSGLTLESIGIESVSDYGGTKDGTFKIDETKLKQAIENNTEEVAKLFTQSTTDTSSNAYNQKGIMVRLKEILYDETVSSKSILAKKVGFEGTVTVVNNELNKQMEEYQKKITQMKTLFATKEQELYNKYAKLETIMNNYNSQMTYLSQSLGLG